MDFDLSVDQLALRDAANALADHFASRERVRAHVGNGAVSDSHDASAGFDDELWKAIGEQGWLAVERSENNGGLGMGMVEVALLAEVLGRHVAPVPFTSTVLAIEALDTALTDPDIEFGGSSTDNSWPETVESLASGSAVGCVADAWRCALDVERSNGTIELTGVPEPVLYGPSADVVIVCAPDAVFALTSGPDGQSAFERPEPAMDRTRELGWLKLDGTPAIAIGGPAAAQRILDRCATSMAAEMLGVAQASLDMAVEYAKQRVQFGKPIGSFQAIKHMLADSLVDVEGMRSVVYYAAWCVGQGDQDSSLAASMAKSWCSDAVRRVTATALQVHGGIGFTWEHDMHLYLKRAQLDAASFGDAPWHRDRITELLRRRILDGRGIL